MRKWRYMGCGSGGTAHLGYKGGATTGRILTLFIRGSDTLKFSLLSYNLS